MRKDFLTWIILLVVVALRYFTSLPEYTNGDKVRVSTTIASEPVAYSNSRLIRVSRLRAYVPFFPEVGYGDRVIVEGIVEDGELINPTLVSVNKSDNTLAVLRDRLIHFYKTFLPEPHSSLVAGVTIGSKSGIPSNFWESLKKTSTAHVVVASGMNVTLVAGFLVNSLILFLPRRRAIVAALAGIWIYALLSGFDAPIVRAAIMGSVAFSGAALGRVGNAWRALVFSALAMIFVRPDWLTDLGFILSFVATASLMLFNKPIERKLMRIPKLVREGLSTSTAAQIGVAPIIYATFGQFNPLSPIINALILWTIPAITILGMVAGIVSLLSIHLGKLILWLTYPLTSWFVWVIELFS